MEAIGPPGVIEAEVADIADRVPPVLEGTSVVEGRMLDELVKGPGDAEVPDASETDALLVEPNNGMLDPELVEEPEPLTRKD